MSSVYTHRLAKMQEDERIGHRLTLRKALEQLCILHDRPRDGLTGRYLLDMFDPLDQQLMLIGHAILRLEELDRLMAGAVQDDEFALKEGYSDIPF